MLISTIIARNYLPQARVLARSFLEHHPDGRVCVLLLDPDGEGRRDDEPFEVITPTQLGLDPVELRVLKTIYQVLELATALKPFLLRHLLVDRGEPTVSYLDPDIEVYAPLDDIAELAARHRIVLTPHRLTPVPPDGLDVDERTFLKAGSYNLGFIAVSAEAVAFLEWWGEHCRRHCMHAVAEGLFVDQRWLDLAVTYYPHHVLRDPGCNVAYWNLDERPLTRTGRELRAGDTRLRFLHLSGYDPDDPEVLSRHQGLRPRVVLSADPLLRELCARYAARLEEEGRSECTRLDYTYDLAAGGFRLDVLMRRVYRQEVVGREKGQLGYTGEVADLPDPFGPREVDAFVELMRTPFRQGPAPGVPRYLYALHSTRPDLQAAFPSLKGKDGNHFLWWARKHWQAELDIPEAMVPSAADLSPARTARARSRRPGVRLVGYLGAELGVGEAGRAMRQALTELGEPLLPVAEVTTANRQNHIDDLPPASDTAGPGPVPVLGEDEGDINLFCVNADVLHLTVDALGTAFTRQRYNIGLWGWELETFPPEYAGAAELIDEVWTYSQHSAAGIREVVDKPVHIVPLPVVERRPSGKGRAGLGLPDEGFLFLFCFDYYSIFDRKNPLAVVEAFCRAFSPGEGPSLVIKSINGDAKVLDQERLHSAAVDRPDIHLWDGYLDVADQRALVAACDAYVSLHRAEGFGYTMAEAMLLGKPVIATGYSGNLEFMTPDNSILIGHTPVRIGDGAEPYPAGAIWADPDVEEAAVAMRKVVEDPSYGRSLGERAQHDIKTHHSPEARGPLVGARLAAARALAPSVGTNGRRRLAEAMAGPSAHAARSALKVGRRIARRLERLT